MRPHPAIVLGLALTSACQVGTLATHYQPATGPAGAMVRLELRDRSKFQGELLAVEPAALLLLHGSLLTRIPLSQIRRGKAPKVGFSGNLQEYTRERLRLISRYPQGVSSDLEGRLLRALGQSEVRSMP